MTNFDKAMTKRMLLNLKQSIKNLENDLDTATIHDKEVLSVCGDMERQLKNYNENLEKQLDENVHRMRCVTVYFENKDHFTTSINGTVASITEYYKKGKTFNIGLGPHDNEQKVLEVLFN